jgi:hypothetical protein
MEQSSNETSNNKTMKIKITQIEFVKNKIESIPLWLRETLDEELVTKNFSILYEEYEKRTTDFEFAKIFSENCPTKNGKLEDYNYKIININGHKIWVSLRFWNRETEKPFIEVLYFDGSAKEIQDNFSEIKKAIIEEYKNIEPLNIRFTVYEEDLIYFKNFNYSEDNLIVVKIIESEKTMNTNIRLEQLDSLTDEEYSIYYEEYKKFNKKQPNLSFVKSVEHLRLNEIAKKNFLFKICKDKDYIGILILTKDDFFEAFYGVGIFDKIIFERYRGNNYSFIAQQLAEQELVTKNLIKNSYLIGTIAPTNYSSLKSALKTGRKILMKQIMINLKDYS